jgi:hypothetical protein
MLIPTDGRLRPTADIARSRKRTTITMEAAVRVAANGCRNIHQLGENKLGAVHPGPCVRPADHLVVKTVDARQCVTPARSRLCPPD